jgi:hypothetical protein
MKPRRITRKLRRTFRRKRLKASLDPAEAVHRRLVDASLGYHFTMRHDERGKLREVEVRRVRPRASAIEKATEPPEPLEPTAWLAAEVGRLKGASNIPPRPARFAQQLRRQMVVAVRHKECRKEWEVDAIRVWLYKNRKLWLAN